MFLGETEQTPMNFFTAEQTEDDATLWLVAGLLGPLIEKPAGLAMNK